VVLNEVLVHFVCNIFVCACLWAEVVAVMSPMMIGVQFLFSLIMVFICPCISKREACAPGGLTEGQ
jgi:hypothetical protein